ncbi:MULTISPECIES: ATP-binding protein [Calothrix]|uniref:ATP-binding protein n=2 Tax=Calothrix TaxID=1186 RepID=A0ABR8A2S6_9CYAN|nr:MULTISPECIES: ATP-binding protein [Calothrix]MBD2194191.1 ATP-binding protein [Calothrix parietina FACHB-288]MBD2224987.1 ATP-binding protein [Calothrix anomala FACHB-343]
MTEFYQVLGGSVPKLLGREKVLASLESHLLKPTPDHVSVIGFARYGKSVLLNHLADNYRAGNEYFTTSLYIDFRHATPTTDEEFRCCFAKSVKSTIEKFRPEVAEYIELTDGSSIHELLDFAFGELNNTGDRLLAVLDGFDHVLDTSNITRTLWDNMRTLALHSSLTLVTGSRRPLRELCASEESKSSDFWEIFYDTPLEINKLEDADWEGFLKPMLDKQITIEPAAKREIVVWTGGVPLLAAALMRELCKETAERASLLQSDVERIAEKMVASQSQLISALWDDCSDEMKSDLASAAAKGIPQNLLPHSRKSELERRGFLQLTGDTLKPACKIMEKYARVRTPGVNNLRGLFGNTNVFEENIQGTLELRFAQIPQVDQTISNYVRKAIRDISPSPRDSLVWMRNIAERSLDLIWEKELPRDRSIPPNWINEWKKSGEWKEELLDSGKRLPRSRGEQCNILRLATGTQNSHFVTKYVTKSTYLLVNHVKSVGDFGQHRESRDFINIGTAASFCMSAIALCESLYNDLNRS